MRSYKFTVKRIINQLVPHYLGRRFVLFMHSLMFPLQSIADKWEQWAFQTRMEVAMTSQIIMYEYFLNYMFKKYFIDASQRIIIADGPINGVPLYREDSAAHVKNTAFYYVNEKSGSDPVFKFHTENDEISNSSFVINCPEINDELIAQEEVANMITYYTNRYKIAGKKYIITFG